MGKDKVMLIIRDGYGKRRENDHNAVNIASTPYNDKIIKNYPHTTLKTDGEAVGLPKGFMGGSEAGHLTIGSGRIILQNLKKIDKEIRERRFFNNQAFHNVIKHVKRNNGKVHLAGLLQNKGVHAHQKHLFALMRVCKEAGLKKDDVIIHIFTDGRDSPRKSAEGYIKELKKTINNLGIGVIKTVIGRYYSMDRDTRWDRTKLAYDLLIHSKGKKATSVTKCLEDAYDDVISDEFIKPYVIGNYAGLNDEDGIIFYNYRTDRMRQLCKALFEQDFDKFPTRNHHFARTIMTSYYDNINSDVAYHWDIPKNTLGDVIANNNLKQLRISETEKYPHVTFFFNGQANEAKKDEKRILIPSPRDVATYDEKPEMSIYKIKEELLKEIKKEEQNLIVVNYVNGDMVGHTGEMDAAVKACEAVDDCLKETVELGLKHGYTSFVFADHGNCEEMSGPHQTSHTLNLVDFILVSPNKKLQDVTLKEGGLKDIATTALTIMNVKIPKEMTGQNLIIQK